MKKLGDLRHSSDLSEKLNIYSIRNVMVKVLDVKVEELKEERNKKEWITKGMLDE